MGLITTMNELGAYSYASGRCRVIMKRAKEIPRETRQVLEAEAEKEMEEFENKLISFAPESIKDDLKLFLKGKREVNQLKIQFRKSHKERRRRQGLKMLQLSKWGEKITDAMSNQEVEHTLDKEWFHVMKSTKLRTFIIDLEQLYDKWYEARMNGEKFEINPLPLVNEISNSNPLSWGIILKCYYTKLEQIKKRRELAWEGY